MSISVTIDQDTFSYDKINGEIGWFVTNGVSQSWGGKNGRLVPYSMFSTLFSAANEIGVSEHDFTKVLIPDIDSKVAATIAQRAIIRASNRNSSDDEIKPVSRKSPLRQSIKLF